MTLSDHVVFGGGTLDRAAHLRGQSDALRATPEAVTIVLWQGKPLVAENVLVRMSLDHGMLRDKTLELFLGMVENTPVFATDISGWIPGEVPEIDGFFDQSEQVHPLATEGEVFRELRGMMNELSPLDAELAATARALFNWHNTHGFCARCGAESDVVSAGWQRNCASCGSSHFPRTDPVVIMLVEKGDEILLGRSPGWPEGMYSCLAGFVEPGETIEAAVRREVLEETGVRVGDVEFVASQPWPFPNSLMFGCRGQALSKDIELDVNEVEDALWLCRADMERVFCGEHDVVKPPRKGAIAGFLLENWLANRV